MSIKKTPKNGNGGTATLKKSQINFFNSVKKPPTDELSKVISSIGNFGKAPTVLEKN